MFDRLLNLIYDSKKSTTLPMMLVHDTCQQAKDADGALCLFEFGLNRGDGPPVLRDAFSQFNIYYNAFKNKFKVTGESYTSLEMAYFRWLGVDRPSTFILTEIVIPTSP